MHVLSVGAGPEQTAIIQFAKDIGLYVIAIDGRQDAEAAHIADEFVCIDIKAEKEVIKVAKSFNVKYVLPSPLGRYLTTVGAINDALVLPGPSKKDIENFVIKDKFIEYLRDNNFYTPRQVVVPWHCQNRLFKKIEEIGYPCIVKPVEGSGSRGVYVIKDSAETANGIEQILLSLKKNEAIIVEEFVTGKEFGVDGFCKNSEAVIVAIREKSMTALPYRQETGYVYPPTLSLKMQEKISEEVIRLFESKDSNNYYFHADVIVCENEVFIVEATMRPPGLNITSLMYNHIFETNPLHDFIRSNTYGTEMQVEFNRLNNSYIGLFFFDLPFGSVTHIPEFSDFYDESAEVIYIESKITKDLILHPVKNGIDLTSRGHFIIKAAECSDMIKLKNKILNSFDIRR